MSSSFPLLSFLFLSSLAYYLHLFTSATAYGLGGPGSFYSYTATNHLSPSVPTVLYSPSLYRSSSPLYSYSYLPAASTAVIPPPPLAYHPSVHTSVWPATTSTYFHKPVNFYVPCLKQHVTSFSHVITAAPLPVPRKPLVGKPVKTKPNNSTEHVFKPIYYPGVWGEYKPPVFSYQGTIQHGAPKKEGAGETAVSTTTTTAATPAAEAAEETAAEKPAEPAKAEPAKAEEEVDEGEKEDEKADAAAAAEATTKKAEEIKPAKAKRASVSIAKGYGTRKMMKSSNNKRRNVWNFRSA